MSSKWTRELGRYYFATKSFKFNGQIILVKKTNIRFQNTHVHAKFFQNQLPDPTPCENDVISFVWHRKQDATRNAPPRSNTNETKKKSWLERNGNYTNKTFPKSKKTN